MNRTLHKILAAGLAASLLLAGVGEQTTAQAAKKPKLNKKKVTLKVGGKVRLKVKNKKGRVKWFSSNKKVASVNNKGVVKAKKKGKAKITARTGGRKLVCKVTVKKKGGAQNPRISLTPPPMISFTPAPTATARTSAKPSASAGPTSKASAGPSSSTLPGGSSQPPASNIPPSSSEPGPTATTAPIGTTDPGGNTDYNTKEYFITINTDGGTIDGLAGKDCWTVDAENSLYSFTGFGSETISVPAPVRDGYVFKQWVRIDDYAKPIPGSEVTSISYQVGPMLKDTEYVEYRAIWTEQGQNPVTYDKDVLTVGSGQAALGMSLTELKEANGEPARIGKSPQGTDVYVYNSGQFKNYFLVYVQNSVVVGMATMSSGFQYKYTNSSSVSYGDTAPKDFSQKTNYAYQGQYLYDSGDAYVMIFEDKKSSKIHAVQVFAKSLAGNLDDLIKVENLIAKGRYSADVSQETALELRDFANAFRVSQGLPAGTELSSVHSAQDACDELAKQGGSGGNTSGSLIDKYGKQYPGGITDLRQVSGDRSPDAFGFMTWWLDREFGDQSDKARENLLFESQDEVVVSGGFTVDSSTSYAVVHIAGY